MPLRRALLLLLAMVPLLGGCGGGDTSSVERYVKGVGTPDAIALVDGVPWVLDTEANEVFAVDPVDRSISARVPARTARCRPWISRPRSCNGSTR